MDHRHLNVKAKLLEENSEKNHDSGLSKALDVASSAQSTKGKIL